MRRYKEAPGVTRLRADEARQRPRKVSPWLADPVVVIVPVPVVVPRKPKPKPVAAAQPELL